MASNDPDFETKAADIIGLYLNPPQHAAVFCVDEKTAIQALDRKDPVLPLSPGRAERHGFEYFRHGTLSLYAAFNTKTGKVLGKTAARHTSAEFVAFLADIVVNQPRGKEIHVIADNLSAHKTALVARVPGSAIPSVHLHFTPTYSSWLNQVELWFAKIERDVIARGVFTSVPDLKRKLMRYIRHYNKSAEDREVEVLRSHSSHHSQFSRYSPLPAGRVVEILDAGVREPQLRLAQRAAEALVLAVEPLGVDEQRQALVKAETVAVRASLLLGPGRRQCVQSQGHQLLHRRFVQHGRLLRSVGGVVVVGAAHVLVRCGHAARSDRGQRHAIEAVLQDRVDMAIGARADGDRARARGLEPLGAVALGEAQDAEARAVALLGVRAIGEDRLDQLLGGGPDALGPVDDPRRRPLQVLLVGLRHVRRDRRVAAALAAARMRGHALAALEDLDRRRR